jgi:hypothetical protein
LVSIKRDGRPDGRRVKKMGNNFTISFLTSAAVNGEIVMVWQALIAGESADARLAVALTRLDVAGRGR